MATVLILGAYSDIAQAMAYQFASEGHQLLLAARNAERLTPLVSDIQLRHQVQARALHFDALDYASHPVFYQSLPQRPDVVVWVAGYLGDAAKARTDFAEALQILEVNYTGAVSILDLAAQELETRKAGAIVAITSVAADRGRQSNYHYGSAKAGLKAYLSGLRNRLFHAGVHVLEVRAGYVNTRMTAGMPLPKPLTASPEQVALDVSRALKRKTNVLYTLWIWRWVMLIIRSIPEPIFKRLKL